MLAAHHLLCDGRGLLQLTEEFAKHYVLEEEPAFAEEHLIEGLSDLPPKSDLPWISKAVIGDANKKWAKEQHKVTYEEYLAFEKEYIRQNPVGHRIRTVEKAEMEKILAECRQAKISVNDYLIAQMMQEKDTNKVVIAADIRSQVKGYVPGAMGNYSTAFSVVVKKKASDRLALAGQVSARVKKIIAKPQKEMLVLACYLRMHPELIDAVAVSTLGSFSSPAGTFVGKNMFGFAARSGCSITNLGRIQSDVIQEAVFIPPASPANRIIWGVLTVNGTMRICEAGS